MLKSIQDTAADTRLLEVWIAIDEDDPASIHSINRLMGLFSFVRFVVVPRQTNFSVGYYNKLLRFVEGAYIMALNDDCLFVTPRWDRLGAEALQEYQQVHGGIVYGRCQDNQGVAYSSFPVLSREATQALGVFFHPEFTTWGADIHLHDIFNIVGRIVDLPFMIEHISHHTGRRERDSVNLRVGQLARYNYASSRGEAMRLANIIKRATL